MKNNTLSIVFIFSLLLTIFQPINKAEGENGFTIVEDSQTTEEDELFKIKYN